MCDKGAERRKTIKTRPQIRIGEYERCLIRLRSELPPFQRGGGFPALGQTQSTMTSRAVSVDSAASRWIDERCSRTESPQPPFAKGGLFSGGPDPDQDETAHQDRRI